jgi:hypothetical protein
MYTGHCCLEFLDFAFQFVLGALFPELKRRGREAEHSLPFGVVVKSGDSNSQS